MTRANEPAGSARTIVVAGSASVLGAVPPFLVGSLAVFVRQDLDFEQSALGVAIAAFFLASAVAAIPGGRFTERVGARRAMLVSASTTGVAMLGVALLTPSWLALVAWLVLAGTANGVAQPAGNLALARGVTGQRKALAFGIKQASIPAATLLAGAAVPLIGLTVGWRWAFATGAVGALFIAMIMPKDPYASPDRPSGRRLREGDVALPPLLVLALAAFCGAAVGTSLASFYVESAVAAGFEAGFAGAMLVVGSLSGILSRLVIGWHADRRDRGHMTTISLLLAFGALGFVGLGMVATAPAMLLPATLLGFAAGWGWVGLFNFTVVRLNPNAPAAATAITQTGIFTGGVLGPATFGTVAENVSFEAAWAMAAGLNLLAALSVVVSRRLLRTPPQSRSTIETSPSPTDDTDRRGRP